MIASNLVKGQRVSSQVKRKLAELGTPIVENQGKAALKKAAKSLDNLVLSSPTLRNQVTLHVSADEAHKALMDSIKNAKKSFHIETFIWHNDEAGNDIARRLGAKVRLARMKGEEFDAKVLIDGLGLRNGTGGAGDAKLMDKMRKYGVDVREFNRHKVSLDPVGIPITHRKLYIADNDSFITGGRNIGDEYLKPTFKNGDKVETSWHDLLYTVKGEETDRIHREFFENWERAGGKAPSDLPKPAPVSGEAKIQSFVTDPHAGTKSLQEAHFKAIRGAQKEIMAIYPYFSDDGLINELISAKRANTAKRAELLGAAQNKYDRMAIDQAVPELQVKVLLPGHREAGGEGAVYTLLNQENARQMLQEGIDVRYFYGGKIDGKEVERFSHFKGMMIDGELLSVGSANGDARTYASNHELVTMISDPKTLKAFQEKVAIPDWESARPASLEALDAAPLTTKLKRKVLEALDFLL
ncbi:phosphatidylserine/phosphatidylglycerophosphate/cardiolipin synthase family protein [bacterium]|nr:phosphatidylserine/phosphatidylglycerophosphate/cardiolipin synthase family protein [bacterium]